MEETKKFERQIDDVREEINNQVNHINEVSSNIERIEHRINEKNDTMYGNIISIMSVFISIAAYLFVAVQSINKFFPNDGDKFIKFVEYGSFIALILIVFNLSLIYMIRKTFFSKREDVNYKNPNDLNLRNFWYEIKLNLFEYKLVIILMAFLSIVCFIAFLINNISFFGDIIRKDITYIILSVFFILLIFIFLYFSFSKKIKKLSDQIEFQKKGVK